MRRHRVVSMETDVTGIAHAVGKVERLAASGQGAYVCVSNVHMCMETLDSSEFRAVVNKADLIVPDGRPIFWAQRLLGARNAEQVRGQDIMTSLCRISGKKKLNIGLYGGSSDELLKEVVGNLKSSYPDIRIEYTYSPPFRPLSSDEDLSVVQRINESDINVLFVGIGCPKQELWMAKHKDQVNCVMLGVGAAFDFIAGSKRHAPRWMQKFGLEWLYRLLSEPKRLWKRYLKQNPRFIYYFGRQLLFGKVY